MLEADPSLVSTISANDPVRYDPKFRRSVSIICIQVIKIQSNKCLFFKLRLYQFVSIPTSSLNSFNNYRIILFGFVG